MIEPTFVKSQQQESRQVLDPEIAHEVMAMMQTVTEPGGTAKDAAILGYHVAGKTGTARIASGGGYSRRYAAFFAGVVPVDNPRFSMAVVVMHPDPSRRGYSRQERLTALPQHRRRLSRHDPHVPRAARHAGRRAADGAASRRFGWEAALETLWRPSLYARRDRRASHQRRYGTAR